MKPSSLLLFIGSAGLGDGGDSDGGGDSYRATLMELTSLRLPYNKLCKPININTGWVLDFRLITI